VATHLRRQPQTTGGSGSTLSPLPFCTGSEINVTYKEDKNASKVSVLPSLFRSALFWFLSLSLSVHCSLLVAGPAVDSRSEMRPLLWAPLEEERLLLAGKGDRGSKETGNGPARSLIGGDEAVC